MRKTHYTLILVESPAKCKKIEEYLGPGHKCLATYGHLRELPSLEHVDTIAFQREPTYTIVDNAIKKKQIEVLRKAIQGADEVVLACDNDREGAAINFHLCQMFHLDVGTTKRIVFNEITEKAVKHAMRHPTTIDMNEVRAQQARQIVDLLVGFKVSPVLWKCVKPASHLKALSAGRCQTPALRLVYDNDCNPSDERKVHVVSGIFTNANIVFQLNHEFDCKEAVAAFLKGSATFSHVFDCTSPVKIFKPPPRPFTTSSLQQAASNLFRFSPKETMRCAQSLYEQGHITYMRTDSEIYSDTFLQAASAFVESQFGADAALKEAEATTSHAHEAIRPTNLSLTDLISDEKCSSKKTEKKKATNEMKLYKLIWENTLKSCMSDATFLKITASLTAFGNHRFSVDSEQLISPGWMLASSSQSSLSENTVYPYLMRIAANTVLACKKMSAVHTLRGGKSHYTEARLVKLLEEKGIGRPSTFSSLIDKIQERGYVKKESIPGTQMICCDFELNADGIVSEKETMREVGKERDKLVLQPSGKNVVEFLNAHFSPLFEYEYTNQMENALDTIARTSPAITNAHEWQQICAICDSQIEALISALSPNLNPREVKIDDQHTRILGKYGPVVKCVERKDDGKEVVSFKAIGAIPPATAAATATATATDPPAKTSYVILGQFEGEDVVLKKGKFGLYATWGEKRKALKQFGNRPLDNISFEEVKPLLQQGGDMVRMLTSTLSIRRGKTGDYLFFKTPKMKKPQFHDVRDFAREVGEDYTACDVEVVKSWVFEKYGI